MDPHCTWQTSLALLKAAWSGTAKMVVGHHGQRPRQLQQDYPPSAGSLTSLPFLLALWEVVPVLFRKTLFLSFPDSGAQTQAWRCSGCVPVLQHSLQPSGYCMTAEQKVLMGPGQNLPKCYCPDSASKAVLPTKE